MAMGRRKKRVRQEGLWTPTAELPVGASHPFYQRLNQILDERKFDEYVETICEDFYAGEVGRPGLSPGIYVVDPIFWTEKRPFLRWWAALKIEESQCQKPARVIRPA